MFKKTLTAALVCLCGQVALTQMLFYEDFSGGVMPPGWTIQGFPGQLYNPWKIDLGLYSYDNAGGKTPELYFFYPTAANDTSRIISPVVDMTGAPDATLSFNYRYDWNGNGLTIGVATRFGTGPWTVVWQESPTWYIAPVVQNISLNNLGQSDFQFCFFVQGNFPLVEQWYIDNIKIHTPPDFDARLFSMEMPKYVEAGVPFPLGGVVYNEGNTPIQSFDVSYSVNGGPVQVQNFSGMDITLGNTAHFSLATQAMLDAQGKAEIVSTISNINGSQDQNGSNDSFSNTVWAVTHIPDKMVLAEEGTGTWCGWCVRGACFMHYMEQTYPDTWIGVAVHNNDLMTYIPYNNALSDIIPYWNGGYPAVTTDRTRGYLDPSQLEPAYLNRIKVISPASIQIHNYAWSPVTRKISFNLRSEFVAGFNGALRFGAIIVEDSLTGWAQANNYSGGDDPMCGFEDLPNPVPASMMHYDHVARTILSTPFGTPGSVPADQFFPGDEVSYTYSYQIPLNWKYNNLRVIGFLRDVTTGEILNATNKISSYLVGVNDTAPDQAAVSVFPNPVKNSIVISSTIPLTGARFRLFDILGKTVLTGNLSSENTSVELGHLPAGAYLLNVGENMNQTFKVIKE